MSTTLTSLGVLSLGLFGGLAPQPATLTAAAPDAPICDPGKPVYKVECTGPTTSVQLDGTGSTGTGRLTFFWAESCPNAYFDDPTSPMPILTLEVGSCFEECGGIKLTVTDSTGSSTCGTAVVVVDTTPPELTCPPNVTVGAGEPTDPDHTGTATASDACAGALAVTWEDEVVENVITRTWSTTDGCFPQTCVQTITIEAGEEEPGLDIKPTSCPNPINVKSKGVIPVAITGASGFDVGLIDPSSLLLSRHDGVGGSVAPVEGRMRISDTATPFSGELCDCHGYGADGFLDLNMKFVKQDVVSALLLASVPDKTTLQLDLSGKLMDGSPFTVSDCIRVHSK